MEPAIYKQEPGAPHMFPYVYIVMVLFVKVLVTTIIILYDLTT